MPGVVPRRARRLNRLQCFCLFPVSPFVFQVRLGKGWRSMLRHYKEIRFLLDADLVD